MLEDVWALLAPQKLISFFSAIAWILWKNYKLNEITKLLWFIIYIISSRSSRLAVFYKRPVLKNLAKITVKHLCQSLFLKIKLQAQEYNFTLQKIKNRNNTQGQGFSCEFCEIVKNTVFIEHLLWLLLSIIDIKHVRELSSLIFLLIFNINHFH